MILGRDDLSRLVQERAELTLAEALLGLGIANFADIGLDPEDYFIIGDRLAFGGRSAGAAVGFRSASGLKNQTTSQNPGLLISTHQVVTWGAAAASHRLKTGGALVGSGVGTPRDLRWPVGVTPVGLLVFDNTTTDVAIGGNLVSDGIGAAALTPVVFECSIVLGPGQQYHYSPSADNVTVGVHQWWREFDLKRK